MFSQLGNIKFEALTSPESFSKTDGSVYAEHALIGLKPRLQPVGHELEEISLSVRFRAEFINPANAILELKKRKDQFEILPYVTGTGRFLGDYVIISIGESHNVCLPDGELIEASVELTLKEYVNTDKVQQQQIAARKQAFATSDKKPVGFAVTQKETPLQLASQDVSAIKSQGNEVEKNTLQYENNVSQRNDIQNKIEKALGKISGRIDLLNDKIDTMETLQGNPIFDVINAVRNQIQSFQIPIQNVDQLKANNRDLQAILGQFSKATRIITNAVILRR